jgi:hypothetical protein
MLQLLVSACKTLANMLMKAEVLDENDMENSWGCLRPQEKLLHEVAIIKVQKTLKFDRHSLQKI